MTSEFLKNSNGTNGGFKEKRGEGDGGVSPSSFRHATAYTDNLRN